MTDSPQTDRIPFTFDWALLGIALLAFLIGLVGASTGTLAANHALSSEHRTLVESYVSQLRYGNGLVFNPSEDYLLIAAPLYLVATALIGSDLLFAFSIVIGVVSLWQICLRHAAYETSTAVLVSVGFALSYPLWSGAGTAYPAASALSLLALLLFFEKRWAAAAFALAAAALCAPETLTFGALGAILAAREEVGRRFLLPYLATLGAAFLFLLLYYGHGLWAGLITLPSEAPSPFDAPSLPFLLIVVVAALPGWWNERKSPETGILGGWIALYLVIVFIWLGQRNGYAYAPVIGAALLLAAQAFNRYPIISVLYAFLMAVGVLYVSLGAVNELQNPPIYLIPPEAQTLGVMDKTLGLQLERTEAQSIISFDGAFQPEMRAFLERGDLRSALIRYAPDALIIPSQTTELPDATLLEVFGYQPYALDAQVLRRTAMLGTFETHPADVPYGFDIRMMSYAPDKTALQAREALRLRLDWQISRAPRNPITVIIRLLSANGEVITQVEDVAEPSVWRAAQVSTYHAFKVPEDAPTGSVTLEVSLKVNGGTLHRQVFEPPLELLPPNSVQSSSSAARF